VRLLHPPWGVCKREVRIQESGVRIIVHVARERVPVLNTEFWLLNTALAEPTKEVLQAPQVFAADALGDPTGKVYTVRNFYRARTLAGRMAIDRGLILQTDASPA
jgi:hypothetical protein